MVAMLVKLLSLLIASNTSLDSSLEVRFARSKYAPCCKRFSFNFVVFITARLPIFPNVRWKIPFFRVVVSSFETSWNSSWDTLIRSLASWKYINLSIAKGFGLLYKGIFACCRWIITKLLRKFRCHLQWPSRTYTWQSHRCFCYHPRLPPNFVKFWPTPDFSLLRISFCLSDRSFISCLTAFTFSIVRRDTI